MPPTTSAQLILAMIILTLFGAIISAWVWAIARMVEGRPLLPSAPVIGVPWTGVHVVGIVVLYIGLTILVPILLLTVTSDGVARVPGTKLGAGLVILLVMAINVSFLAIAPAALAWLSGARRSDFGLGGGGDGRDVLRGVVAWPLLAPIVLGINFVATQIWKRDQHPLEIFIGTTPTALNLVLAAISAVVAAPLAEEFLFRGVLLGWLDRLAVGRPLVSKPEPVEELGFLEEFVVPPGQPTAIDVTPASGPSRGVRLLLANLAVSFLFAAIHETVWPSPIPLFFLSVGLGVLYQRTGSLVAPIALHATFNGITTALFFLQL